MIKTIIIPQITLIFFLIGCTNSTDIPPSLSMSSLDSVPTLPMVDAKTLLVSHIQVVQFANPEFNGALQPLVHFNYSGSAEYVEVQTCSDMWSGCRPIKNIFETRSALANSENGANVIVKLRACVDPARAIGGTNCGPWVQTSYKQWAIVDKDKADMQQELESIELAANDLSRQLDKLLKMKKKRAEKCRPKTSEQQELLSSERTITEALGRLGQGTIGAIGSSLARKSSEKCAAASSAEEKAKSSILKTGNLYLTDSSEQSQNSIGPSLSTTAVSTIVNRMAEALDRRASVNKDAETAAAAQCLRDQTISSAQPDGLTYDDLGYALPGIATALFDISAAPRKVSLEGICIDTLGTNFETALQSTEEATRVMAAQLQARSERLAAKIRGARP
jgi:hypothetical protein